METLIVTNDNYLGLTKCKNTSLPMVRIKGSFYFYLENVEIGGDRQNPELYYKIDSTLYNLKTNHALYEGETCKIEIDADSLKDIDRDILCSLESHFEELFEDLYDKDAQDEMDTLWNLPY